MDHGRRINALTYLLALVCCLIMAQSALSAVQIGQRIGEFQLEDASGKTHSLESYLSSGKVVVLCFWSFKCPVSLAYNRRLEALQEKYRPRGVAVLGIASNANESPAEIERNTANLNLPFPVLIDKDGAVADRLGATHTPQIFVIDRSGVLRYRGALDNNREAGESGRTAYAEEALEAVLSGRSAAQPETKAFGCSLKRKAF